MQLYTLQQATADLDRIIARAVGDHEEAAIVCDSGAVFWFRRRNSSRCGRHFVC